MYLLCPGCEHSARNTLGSGDNCGFKEYIAELVEDGDWIASQTTVNCGFLLGGKQVTKRDPKLVRHGKATLQCLNELKRKLADL